MREDVSTADVRLSKRTAIHTRKERNRNNARLDDLLRHSESPSFKAVSRERRFQVQEKKAVCPPVGKYNPKYSFLDKYIVAHEVETPQLPFSAWPREGRI